ncbi:MAG TPA: hypothetical protein P5105_06790 [Victivallales bacterium]|nr:hypothetical protein [Victivallales bacterium]
MSAGKRFSCFWAKSFSAHPLSILKIFLTPPYFFLASPSFRLSIPSFSGSFREVPTVFLRTLYYINTYLSSDYIIFFEFFSEAYVSCKEDIGISSSH